jgi:hypothetical protein
MSALCFAIAFAFLATHELDAMRCREWRIHPFFSWMEEATGNAAFVLAHVPVFAALFWFAFLTPDEALRAATTFWISVFCIVHVGLHIAFLWHPKNEFRSALSWSLIVGAGLFGALDLVLRS